MNNNNFNQTASKINIQLLLAAKLNIFMFKKSSWRDRTIYDKNSVDRYKKRKLIYWLIAVVALFFLVEAIWASVSLHAWIVVCSCVAAFHIVPYFIKHKIRNHNQKRG